MTLSADRESLLDRVIQRLMVILFWSAFACLGGGLALWLVNHHDNRAGVVLSSGLLSLMLLPTLRLIAVVGTSLRARDWIMFASTMLVLAILLALTLRDAL